MNELSRIDSKTNVFCVNTPFQLFVVKQIISLFLTSEKCLVISTIRNADNDNDTDIIKVNNSILSLLSLRKILYEIRCNIEKCSFYIPHLGSLLSSVFFNFADKFHRPINIYYEGVALYYDPIVKQPISKRIKRQIQAFLLGVDYQYYSQLYPQKLIDKVETCYAPKDIMLDKYKNVKTFSFKHKNIDVNLSLLVLLSNRLSSEIQNILCKVIRSVVKNSSISKIYIKPHYELADCITQNICADIRSWGIKNLVVLDKKKPIESLYADIQFSVVICQAFSSALINMKLIFQEQPKIYIIEKNIEMETIAKKFYIDYE